MIYNLLIFILVCWGLTQILVYGSIFDKIRPKEQFFNCTMCVGFWVGIIVTLSFYYFADISFLKNIYLSSIAMGFLSSGTSHFLCNLSGDEGLQIEIRRNK